MFLIGDSWFIDWQGWAQWLVEGFLVVFEWVMYLLGQLFNPFLEAFFTVVDGAMDLVEEGLNAWTVVIPYWDAANAWIPIEFAINCLVAYYALLGLLLLWRVVKAHIPTLG